MGFTWVIVRAVHCSNGYVPVMGRGVVMLWFLVGAVVFFVLVMLIMMLEETHNNIVSRTVVGLLGIIWKVFVGIITLAFIFTMFEGM